MFVYLILNTLDGKYYIGKWRGVRVSDRWAGHLREVAKGSTTYLHNAIRKHGAEHFSVHIIAESISDADLACSEREMIALFRSCERAIGYNITAGGEGASYLRSEDTKRRMSQGRKRMLQADRAFKDKLIDHCKMIAKQKIGTHHTEKSRVQIAATWKRKRPVGNGIVFTPEIRQRMREARAAFFQTEEGMAQRARLSANKGNGNFARPV